MGLLLAAGGNVEVTVSPGVGAITLIGHAPAVTTQPAQILTGGGAGNSKSSPAYEWELELRHAARMAAIAKTMAQSDRPQARRIAKKLEDYTGDIRQAESLRRAIAKLEAVQRERTMRTALEIEKDEALRAAARELDNILLDEEDAMHAILAIEEFETRLMLSVLGIKLN